MTITKIDKLDFIPEVGPENNLINTVVKEGEKIGAHLFLAEKSLDIGDLTSASLYVREEFHSEVPLYYDCGKMFEKIADVYVERKEYEKAIENIEYSISSWMKEADRVKSLGGNTRICYNNINKLEKINKDIYKLIHNSKSKLNMR